jgi:hypothetical protein
MPSAAVRPLDGSPKPLKSGGWVRYVDWISMSGFTAVAPALKPASNFAIRGTWTPPMKPTLPVVDFRAAAAPTRKEPCSSAKTRLEMLSPVASALSTIAKLVSGNSGATFASGSA